MNFFKKSFFIITTITTVFIFLISPLYLKADSLPNAQVKQDFSASSYKLINPIGNIAEVQDQDSGGLSNFFNLLIKIVIALAGAIAVLMVIVGGIQYLGTDSIWEKGESVSRMTGAIGGIILLLCSYTILYIINPDLVNIRIGMKKVSEEIWQPSTGFGSSSKSSSKFSSLTDVKDAKEICDVSWPDAQCSTLKLKPECKAIFTYVDKLTNVDDQGKKYIKAWAMEESGCQSAPTNYAGVAAYGMFQFTIPTAQTMAKGCSVDKNNINKAYLENVANTESMVCMAANLYNYKKGVCGSNIYNIIAGLEGDGACQKSKDCTDTFVCTNEQHRSWSCLYDDPNHTTKNTGHIETRIAVQKVKYCMDSL